jgi:prepilin signal peptidase PulO-like enzyme (type II secretory pathway)
VSCLACARVGKNLQGIRHGRLDKLKFFMVETIIFFLLGLIIGSFLNVVVYRIEIVESILGRSMCPHCRRKVRWYDNVPLLSFALLRGQCRDCQGKISWQYPFVEFMTGLLFAATAGVFFVLGDVDSWVETFFYLTIFSAFLVIIIYDIKHMEIPMLVLWVGVILAILYLLGFDCMHFQLGMGLGESRLFQGISGALLAFSFFFILVFASRERWMGMGDAYLGIFIGLVTGWPLILSAMFFSYLMGSIVGVVLILAKKKTLQSQIPFGPFLAIGTFCAIIIARAFPNLQNLIFPF